jgi:heterokaryon incompatibility protein (HET)
MALAFRSRSASDIFSVSYDALESQQIRTLTVLPGDPSTPLRCLLRTVSLDDPLLAYEALSWTWGPIPKKMKVISINDVPHSVRPSLYDALINLRHEQKQRTFWIDAICINQQGKDEKMQQIPLMSKIYSRAQSVAVWLGNAADDSDFIMKCLGQNIVPKTTRFHDGVFKLLLRPWFGRSWVLQEFVLNANEPRFFTGRSPSVPWSTLRQAALDVLQNPGLSNDSSFPGKGISLEFTTVMMRLQVLNGGRARYQSHSTEGDVQSLAFWLYFLKYSSATDPRDKIYGILGLVSSETLDAFEKHCTVSYTRSLLDTYRDAALFMLTEEQNFRTFLHYWTLGGQGVSGPSWVLDFDCPYQPLPAVFRHKDAAGFNAIRVSDDSNRLFIKAIILDDIDSLLQIGDFQAGWGSLVGTKREQRMPLTRRQLRKATALGAFVSIVGNIRGKKKGWTSIVRDSQNALKYVYTIRYIDELINRKKIELAPDFELAEPFWKTSISYFSDQNLTPKDFPDRFETSLKLAREIKGSLHDLIKASISYNTGIQISRKTFFFGQLGYYGMTEVRVQKGDVLALLFPENFIPFILRPKGNVFEMIGPTYIPDAMRDRAIVKGVEKMREITLV